MDKDGNRQKIIRLKINLDAFVSALKLVKSSSDILQLFFIFRRFVSTRADLVELTDHKIQGVTNSEGLPVGPRWFNLRRTNIASAISLKMLAQVYQHTSIGTSFSLLKPRSMRSTSSFPWCVHRNALSQRLAYKEDLDVLVRGRGEWVCSRFSM